MKTLLTLTTIALLCGCVKPDPYPVFRVRDYDPKNNRVDQNGNLLPWTNWQAGFLIGTNWIKVFQAVEP